MIRSLLRLTRGLPSVNPSQIGSTQMQTASETNVDDNVTSLADHQRQCGERADVIIGLALQLRAAIRSAPVNLPLPDEELDGLQHALAVFLNASKRYGR